ncbi:unnamed protein product [Paramecium sonneborni]|uniref:Uncharacterized protein n=1 Tax=Paramecium sonneborni TaxID=65129 RepID=A0A8S1LQK0_9CILI|nr:unnamed protein product [Paramecium sonneborni]
MNLNTLIYLITKLIFVSISSNILCDEIIETQILTCNQKIEYLSSLRDSKLKNNLVYLCKRLKLTTKACSIMLNMIIKLVKIPFYQLYQNMLVEKLFQSNKTIYQDNTRKLLKLCQL